MQLVTLHLHLHLHGHIADELAPQLPSPGIWEAPQPPNFYSLCLISLSVSSSLSLCLCLCLTLSYSLITWHLTGLPFIIHLLSWLEYGGSEKFLKPSNIWYPSGAVASLVSVLETIKYWPLLFTVQHGISRKCRARLKPSVDIYQGVLNFTKIKFKGTLILCSLSWVLILINYAAALAYLLLSSFFLFCAKSTSVLKSFTKPQRQNCSTMHWGYLFSIDNPPILK